MSCKVILVVVITAKDPALGSSHKRLINISLRVVGRLEYWNIGILEYWNIGPKLGTLPNLGILKCPCIL
jgi:hypothetical protein